MSILFNSYEQAFKQPLMKIQSIDNSYRLQSQELFAMENAVIAHDNQNNPCLIYANAAALQLWKRPYNGSSSYG